MFPHTMKAMPGEAIFFQSLNCNDIFVQEEMFHWGGGEQYRELKSICGCLSSFLSHEYNRGRLESDFESTP